MGVTNTANFVKGFAWRRQPFLSFPSSLPWSSSSFAFFFFSFLCHQQLNSTPLLPFSAIKQVIDEICEILEADRATLFMVDYVTEQLVIKAAVGAKDIRIPWDKGIAGNVYMTGAILNIADAYEHKLFNPNVDKTTGYRTQSILAMPIVDAGGKTVAVVQAINKKGQKDSFVAFTEQDRMLLEFLAGQVGVILRNCQLRDNMLIQKRKTQAMLSMCRSLYGQLGINSLMFTITECAPKLVEADRCTMYATII